MGSRREADMTLTISLIISLALASSEWRSAPALFLSGCLVGFFMELIGIHYGIPFGKYSYLSFEGVSLWGVPIPIALAWGLYLYTAYLASLPIAKRNWRIVFTSLLMVVLDMAVDPVMVDRGVWIWKSGGPWFGIPLSNFLGWFVTSALALSVFEQLAGSSIQYGALDKSTRLISLASSP
ncbi:MAG: carotenoid biosynthesis protein [Candidatus Korarchaeota archaeon]|nr:carotenoid biosynthesis protein [Candidatus Korarchaeota archaeon]